MKILHLLSAGGIGGIEVLCRDIAELSQDDNEFCCLFKGGEIAEQMNKADVPVYFLYNESKIKRLLHLIKLVKKNKYDVIIVHHEGFGIYLAYLLCMTFYHNAKYLKYLHCSFEPEYFYVDSWIKNRLNYWVLKKAINSSDGLIAVSEFVKKSYVKEFAISDDNVTVIYNGIKEVKDFCLGNKVLDNEPVRILYAGRLVRVKGVQILLGAAKQLLDEEYNIELEILGGGPQRTEYEQLAEELGIKKKVYFRGYRLDKEAFLEQAHIFCYPSVWQEAFGISIIEAMQKGLICVASKVGGIPEIITDGRDGYLVEANDDRKLAEALKKAVSSYQSGEALNMQNEAMKRAKDFNVCKMIEALSTIYR